jgi:peptide/nickel transport system substrate-binding protein
MKRSTLSSLGAVAIAATVALSACTGASPNGEGASAADTDLALGLAVQVQTFDPAGVQEGNHVIYAQPVYDSLLKREPNGDISPWLATEWNWNDARTELTLSLRDDVDFTDGTHFDAEAAKANLLHFQAGGGPHADFLAGMTDVRVDEDYTITIVLDAPNPSLENYLGNMAGMMASPDALDDPSIATTPVGSGPYVLDEAQVVTGDTYVYTRNEDYWDADAFPYDTITLKPQPRTMPCCLVRSTGRSARTQSTQSRATASAWRPA